MPLLLLAIQSFFFVSTSVIYHFSVCIPTSLYSLKEPEERKTPSRPIFKIQYLVSPHKIPIDNIDKMSFPFGSVSFKNFRDPLTQIAQYLEYNKGDVVSQVKRTARVAVDLLRSWQR